MLRARARGRSLTVAALSVLATGLAGCAAATSTNVTITGKTLTIYASEPAGVGGSQVQDVFDAEQLALSQKQSEVTGFKLRFVKLQSSKLSDNARTAIQDTSTIAYLGEIAPSHSEDTVGITNAQDVLQVSPADTALELTQATAAVPGAPDRYYESLKTYSRTFARVVPNTAQEAKAQVQEMQALGVKRLYIGSDGSAYGLATALAVRTAAGSAITIASTQSGADAIFYAAGPADEATAARTFTAAATANPSIKLFGPSSLDNPTFLSSLGSATPRNLYLSSPGFLPGDLTPAGRTFVADFRSSYGHAPAPEAIFGYEAMASVLDVLHQEGPSANDRSKVVKQFFAIRNRSSVLGTYSINSAGDTSLAPFVFSRLKAGQLTPFRFLQVQG